MRNSQSGFTLLEMIVTIVIMAFVAGLVLARQPWHSAGLNTEVTVRALVSTLRLARSRAIAQDRDVSVVTSPIGFSVDGGPPWLLPANQSLSTTQVVFMPDGGSSGETVLLAAGPRRINISINWLTGRVMSHEFQ
jgi:general secretion pathway protein H